MGEEGFVPEVQHRTVDAGYFEAMRVPVLGGRAFQSVEPVPAVIVNRTLVERHFGGADPVGRRITMGGRYVAIAGGQEPAWYLVVGVVEDEVQVDLRTPVMPQVYEPHSQDPRSTMTVVLRASADPDPGELGSRIRTAVAELDRAVPVEPARAMTAVLHASLSRERFLTWVTGGFSGFALLLAATGIYGVLSYWVASRTRELGVLQALGASPANVRALVLRQGMAAVAIGLVAGLAAALGAGRLVEGLLFRVRGSDPLTLAWVVVVVVLAAAIACVLPVRRAARMEVGAVIRES